MVQINIHEAKTHLSRMLERVERGEDVIIARAGRPVARLVPFEEPRRSRRLGRDAGLFVVPDDFDDPLPEDVLRTFES